MKSFRNVLLDFARALNRHTHRFDGLKARLHLTELASSALVRPINAKAAASILAKLDTTSVLRRATDDSTFTVIMVEKMGDIVASEPIARFLKNRYPRCRVRWLVRDIYRELLCNDPAIDELIAVDCLATAIDTWTSRFAGEPNSILINCHYDGACCPKTLRTFRNPANPLLTAQNYFAIGNLTETFFLAAGLPKTDLKPNLYLPADAHAHTILREPYIVCHTAADEPKRNWTPDKWNGLTDRLRREGHRIVEIGINKTIRTLDFDFTGRRSLTDIGDIIAHAALFIGVESGFAHFANALETPSVVLTGKLGNFSQYTAHSGPFAKSPRFQYARADDGEFTQTIPVDRVLQCIQIALTAP